MLTTRDSKKSNDTVRRLNKHIERQSKELETPLKHRVFLQPERLDLTSLRSVQDLAARLLEHLPHLDAIICNAGIGGCTGIDWPRAIWAVLTDLIPAVTYPQYRLSSVGATTAPQIVSKRKDDNEASLDEPPLAQVFTSNIFGHYFLSHALIPLLSASPDQGRIILTSSIETLASHFNPSDIQAFHTEKAYESSKHLTDILALTSTLQATKPFVQRFVSTSSPPPSQSISLLDNEEPSSYTPESSTASTPPPGRITLADNEYHPTTTLSPKLYLAHPGICATGFVPLPFILYYSMVALMYVARWLGSPWHTCSAYKGACASVWLALIDRDEIEDLEMREGKGKWGSAVDGMGRERVMRTVVEGWGLGGRMGEGELKGRKGTRREFREVGREEREGFEEVGRDAWREMEALRVLWEERMRG